MTLAPLSAKFAPMSVNPDRIRLMLEATASWTEMESEVGKVVAETLRDNATNVEAARSRCHDLLDQLIDAKIKGVTLIRLDIEDQARRLR